MIPQDQLGSVIGATAYGPSGDRIGKVGQVYYDDDSDQPKWVTVNTGLFGTNENFVPLQGADIRGDGVTLAYDKERIKDAPKIAPDAHLSGQEEEELYRYYGIGYGDTTTGEQGTVARETSGTSTDDAMTRSEEQLKVGTETREAGRARLRKHVVTEQQQVSVPVSREEVRVEREPITEANREAAYAGPDISEDEHEVVLREERPVVEKEAVPVERVRLGTETVTEQERVGGEVRKEQVEVDGEDRAIRDPDRGDR
jgi:uncharacterized protein (TIGR02271 family)